MHKKLQQILEELTAIAGVRFALYESPELYMAGTLDVNDCPREELLRLFGQETEESLHGSGQSAPGQPARRDGQLPQEASLCRDGQFQQKLSGMPGQPAGELRFGDITAFPVRAAGDILFLLAQGDADAVTVPGRMAASELQLFFGTVKKDVDKHAFAAAFLAGEVPAGDLYKQAGRFKLKDAPRVLYLFELSQPLSDTGALRMLGSIFADGKQDVLFLRDETHLVLIKAYEKGVTEERAKRDALSAVDTMLSELMFKVRVGYSTRKETLAELPDAHREAAMALRIAGLFQEPREVAAYARLGIARLIYELPRELCELFLQEVFGEELPDKKIDEEMQVTIRRFFENNLNISETARQLYLHRNTLVYRLERLEKLIGLDIRRFDDAMTFQIAMMVLAHYRDMEER